MINNVLFIHTKYTKIMYKISCTVLKGFPICFLMLINIHFIILKVKYTLSNKLN